MFIKTFCLEGFSNEIIQIFFLYFLGKTNTIM